MSNKSFELLNGKVIIDGHPVILPHIADEAFEWHDLIIVKVDPPSGTIFNRNVFGITNQGEILWQIEESPHGTQDDKPYIQISIEKSDNLIAENWNGVSYSVNPSNGKITVSAFNK